MLSIPAYDQIEGVTIFRDDAEAGRYYYLPRLPRIAMQGDKPMFTFLKFQLPPERSTQLGGGYMVFTVALTEPADVLGRIVEALRTKLRAENPTMMTLPPVTLAPVDYLSGDVRLLVIQDDTLVKSVATSRPSLFADNTASVAVGLPELGAQLFHEALKRSGSVAVIEYALTFEARLPAVTINAHVDSQEVKTVVATYTTSQVEDEDTWGNSTTTQVAHRTSLAESMESQGLARVEILKGSVELDDDEMESLRAFAFGAIDDFISKHFLTGGTAVTPEDLKSQWMTFIGQDIRATFDLSVGYRDVVKRNYFPNATINPAFLGVPVEDVVQEIDLRTAPWYFNNLEVKVDTNLDFDKYADMVHSVVGRLSYDDTKEDGTRVTKRDSLIFTRTDRAQKVFKAPLVAVGRDTYSYEVEVHYKGGPVQSAILKRGQSTARDLVLEVPNPGVLEITLATDPAAFDSGSLTAIEVEIEYGDPRNRVPMMVDSVLLTKEAPEKEYARPVFAAVEQPYRLRTTYVLTDAAGAAQRITSAWETRGDRRVAIHTPFDSEFNLTIIPQVDWKEVAQLVVDLDYADEPNDYRVHKTLSFTAASVATTPSSAWKFPLRDPGTRQYRFSQKLLMQDASLVQTEWETQDSDSGTLLVGNAPAGVVTVEVDPADIGLGTTVRRAIVRLTYTDEANGVVDAETLVFRDATPQVWSIARADATVATYTYDVHYVLADGTTRPLLAQQGTIAGDREFLFLPPPPAT